MYSKLLQSHFLDILIWDITKSKYILQVWWQSPRIRVQKIFIRVFKSCHSCEQNDIWAFCFESILKFAYIIYKYLFEGIMCNARTCLHMQFVGNFLNLQKLKHYRHQKTNFGKRKTWYKKMSEYFSFSDMLHCVHHDKWIFISQMRALDTQKDYDIWCIDVDRVRNYKIYRRNCFI